MADPTHKVLIVEDDIPNQQLFKDYFIELGCQGDFVNNGQEAINKLKSGKEYDACFMDILMPVMDGIETTKIIRQEISKDLPIIAITAVVEEEVRQKAFDAGINECILKPIGFMTITKVIAKYKKGNKQ